jgi:hypothetical protein
MVSTYQVTVIGVAVNDWMSLRGLIFSGAQPVEETYGGQIGTFTFAEPADPRRPRPSRPRRTHFRITMITLLLIAASLLVGLVAGALVFRKHASKASELEEKGKAALDALKGR